MSLAHGMPLDRVRRILDAWADLAADPGLWRGLTKEPPSPHVALSLIADAVDPDEPDEEEAETPPPADSGAGLTQAVEADEDESIREGEGTDRFGIQ